MDLWRYPKSCGSWTDCLLRKGNNKAKSKKHLLEHSVRPSNPTTIFTSKSSSNTIEYHETELMNHYNKYESFHKLLSPIRPPGHTVSCSKLLWQEHTLLQGRPPLQERKILLLWSHLSNLTHGYRDGDLVPTDKGVLSLFVRNARKKTGPRGQINIIRTLGNLWRHRGHRAFTWPNRPTEWTGKRKGI